jgi:hypothetical protein
MGGLVARAYVESALYNGDVAQVFMLGTPQAGLDLWHGYLLRQVVRNPGIPSLQELAPEHMLLFNRAHHPRSDVPYYLIVGDYRSMDTDGHDSPPLHLPPGDGIVTLESAHALVGPSVHHLTTADLHGWGTDISLLGLPSYLWPDGTYTYLRNPLRIGDRGYRVEDAMEREPATPVRQVHTPIIEGHLSAGQTVTETVAIDSKGPIRFYLAWDEGDLSLTLIDPQGRHIDQREAVHLSLGTGIIAQLESYVVEEASPGRWQMVIKRACPERGRRESQGDDGGLAPVSFNAYVVLESELTLALSTDGGWHRRGQEIIITATLVSPAGPATEASVEAEVVKPDGSTQVVSLLDDGAHYDQAAGDGVYGGIYSSADLGGYYPLFVSAHGTWQDREFERGAETLVPVSPQSASLGSSNERIETLAGPYADRGQDTDGDGRCERLLVDVRVEVAQASEFALAGTLVDSRGDEIVSTVARTSLDIGSHVMTLPFDGALIHAHGTAVPHRLDQVILMDVLGAAIEVDKADNIYLRGGYDYDDF